jgi:hypothetical protein
MGMYGSFVNFSMASQALFCVRGLSLVSGFYLPVSDTQAGAGLALLLSHDEKLSTREC